jgi:hypothetical protein
MSRHLKSQRARLLVLLVLVCGSASPHAQPSHGMMITVRADRILIGSPDFVPRYLDLPRTLVVPPRATVTLPGNSTWDYIEVAGTLRVDRNSDTVLRFTHLFVLPGGTLDVGTEADPIPATHHVELVVRDVPIDTSRDPFQWGNGLVNFGRQSRYGAAKLPWTTLATGAAAGAQTITLTDDPQGWQAGDEILVTDTAVAGLRRESPVTLTAISGRTVTLSKPLDFEHLAQVDPNGVQVGAAYVANLTRNIVIRSENPDGTRGHTANVGHEAIWTVAYNQFSGLGRTRGETLDSTNADLTHIGTNQAGRYTDHEHHAHGFASRSIGNVLRGSKPSLIGKWGHVVHGTHDALIERNIALDFYGAGFVTEDGYEVRNVFRKNFSAYNFGNHSRTPAAFLDVEANDASPARNSPGSSGDGFWFRGVMNIFDGNVAVNNAIGINLFNNFSVQGNYPSTPGSDLDTPLKAKGAVPLRFQDNVTNANVNVGLEDWGVGKGPLVRHVSVYNGGSQFWATISDQIAPWLVTPLFVCKDGLTNGITSGQAYVFTLTIENGYIGGCAYGIFSGGAVNVSLTGTTFQNAVNLDFSSQTIAAGGLPVSSTHVNVVHKPLAGFPKQYIVFGTSEIWPGGELPASGVSQWLWQIGSQHKITNWQGTGENYLLFEPQSLASTLAWPSTGPGDGQQAYNCPDVGLTMGQCFAKYGMAWNGEALADADAVKLEGLMRGLARKGLTSSLGPPRAVITYPTTREPAIIRDYGGPYVRLVGLLTGTVDGASDIMRVSVDGGRAQDVFSPGPRPRTRQFDSRAVSQGVHEVRTWRLTKAGVPIPESALVFHYVVGPSTW